MVSLIRVIAFLLLFSLHQCNSLAQTTGPVDEMVGINQENKMKARLAGRVPSTDTDPKDINRDEIHSKIKENVIAIGGRKMVTMKRSEDSSTDKELSSTELEASKSSNSGAKVINNGVACSKLSLRRLHGQSQSQSPEVKTGRFAALSADYYIPRPHPPRNN